MKNGLSKGFLSKVGPILISVFLAILAGACFTRTIDHYRFSGQLSLESIGFYIPIGFLALLGSVMFQIRARRT